MWRRHTALTNLRYRNRESASELYILPYAEIFIVYIKKKFRAIFGSDKTQWLRIMDANVAASSPQYEYYIFTEKDMSFLRKIKSSFKHHRSELFAFRMKNRISVHL